MEVRNLSEKTFSNNSLQNYQSKRCDFCLYHSVIFQQLDRLKQAVIMKNQRIKELQEFIAKISSMAFLKTPTLSSLNSAENVLVQKVNESDQQLQNQSSANSQNGFSSIYFKKKFEQSSQISFQESKINTGKFYNKLKQNSTDINRRFQKINELNELKKQLQKKIQQAADKQNHILSEKIESLNNSRQFDTVRTMSEPYEQGIIGSIAHSSCENSRLSQISQTKMKFEELNAPIKFDNEIGFNRSLKKSGSFEDKSSISIIKEYIKKLK